jgi:hypothetical protein
MKIMLIILGYFKWHYGKALSSLTIIWKNFLLFTYNFFSITALFKNFFDPWKRMSDPYPDSFSLRKYFYTFIANSIVRILGIMMRTILIIIGLIFCIILLLLYPVTLIIWLGLPAILIYLICNGIFLIFS